MMSEFKAALTLITVLYVLLVFPALAIHRAGGTENRDAQKFQAQIEEAARDSGIPGLVFALREPEGHAFIGAVGTSDIPKGTPMRTDSSFYIGSISQSMLAAVIFMLEEKDRLRLDDPISNFMEFPGGSAVTVEMLMDHSYAKIDCIGW